MPSPAFLRSLARPLVRIGLAAMLFALLPVAGSAQTEHRWALVLGVGHYADSSVPDLDNTVNDARTMAASLNNMGFEVYYLENATREAFDQTVARIGQDQAGANLGLFFFSGHGVQVDGINYALPSDIAPSGSDFLAQQGISVNQLIQVLKGFGTQNLVVILDSCRNSPFGDQTATGTGLALVDAPENTIIAYSTAPGAVALDGSGANSPYTAALASILEGPQEDVRDVLRLVRARVRLATRGAQTPWYVDNSKGEIIIQPRTANLNATEVAALEVGEVNFATTAWRTIANSADPRDFELFAELYPESSLAPAATRQLDEIKAKGRPSFPLMDLGVPERNPEVPEGLGSITTACDILATGIGDVMAISEPVPHDLVNTHAALRACITAVTNDPENPRLLGLLSRVLRLEKRLDESLYYAEQAAERGNPSAYGAIAAAYRQGLGVEPDYPRAAEAARKGAMMGSAPLRLLLAVFYREGWGVPQSFNEARRWMKLAADAGYAPALVAYGDFFRRGQGVEKDPATAFPFYEQAAVLGSTDAMNLIGLAYMKGEGVPKDLDRGIQWLSRASDEGNPFAAFHLGRAFRDGWGVKKNLAQALAFFRLSSQRNYLGAYINIGDLLAAGGEGLKADLPQAYANYVIAREAALSRDTIDSKEELDKANAALAAVSAQMSAAEIADGERISKEWIEQYGVIDFNLVNE